MWYKSHFAKLTDAEIKTLKAKVLQLPTMSMDMFDNVLENMDEDYPFFIISYTYYGLTDNHRHMCNCPRDNIHIVQEKTYSYLFYYGELS